MAVCAVAVAAGKRSDVTRSTGARIEPEAERLVCKKE